MEFPFSLLAIASLPTGNKIVNTTLNIQSLPDLRKFLPGGENLKNRENVFASRRK